MATDTPDVVQSDPTWVLREFVDLDVRHLHDVASRDFELLHGVVPTADQWTAASVVLLDEEALALCIGRGLPQRADVFLLCVDDHDPRMWSDAVTLGVTFTRILPRFRQSMNRLLADRLRSDADHDVLVVTGIPLWPTQDLDLLDAS